MIVVVNAIYAIAERSLKKIQDFNGIWTRDRDALPTELWGHWRWEQAKFLMLDFQQLV